MLLVLAIGFVGLRIYELWREGPWELPKLDKMKASSVVHEGDEEKEQPRRLQLAGTKIIIDRNLSIQTGARIKKTREHQALPCNAYGVWSFWVQQFWVTAVTLFRGTVYVTPTSAKSSTGRTRKLPLRLGDTIEGFKLSEINETGVVLTKDASRVEVSLDFFRKDDTASQKATATLAARLVSR